MSNPNKQKGTRAESRVVDYLTTHGFNAYRKALAGANDEGDVQVEDKDGNRFTLEVKTGKQTANYNRARLTDWMSQALDEGNNCNQKCLLVIVRYNRKLTDAEVWNPCDHSMWYLDEYCYAYYNAR